MSGRSFDTQTQRLLPRLPEHWPPFLGAWSGSEVGAGVGVICQPQRDSCKWQDPSQRPHFSLCAQLTLEEHSVEGVWGTDPCTVKNPRMTFDSPITWPQPLSIQGVLGPGCLTDAQTHMYASAICKVAYIEPALCICMFPVTDRKYARFEFEDMKPRYGGLTVYLLKKIFHI